MTNVDNKYISQSPIRSWDFRFKIIKTIIFFSFLFFLLSLFSKAILKRESEYFQLTFTILFFTIFLTIFIAIFRNKCITNNMARIPLYMVTLAIQLILFLEVYDIIAHWYAFEHLLPYSLERYGYPSRWEYTFRNVGNMFRRLDELSITLSLSNAFIINTAAFTELTWRNYSQNFSYKNPILNTLYLLIVLMILSFSGPILSSEFFENFLLTTSFIISNTIIMGGLTYALFKIVQTKYIPFILYFSLGVFGSLGLAYLWIPFTRYSLSPYGENLPLLALMGLSWLYPLIFSLFFKSRIQGVNHD